MQPSNLATEQSSTERVSLTLPGWVSCFFVTYNGRKIGPYYARCWKENGRQRKKYIRPADLEKVRVACEAHRQRRRAERDLGKEVTAISGNLNFLFRMTKRILKGQITEEDFVHMGRILGQGITAPGRPKLRRPRSFMYPSFTNHQEALPSLAISPLREAQGEIDGVERGFVRGWRGRGRVGSRFLTRRAKEEST